MSDLDLAYGIINSGLCKPGTSRNNAHLFFIQKVQILVSFKSTLHFLRAFRICRALS